MLAVKVLGIILLSAIAWGHQAPLQKNVEERHYPHMIHADLPLYPALPLRAHISGTVEIQATVENGAVVDAQVKSIEIELADPQNHAVYDSRAKAGASPYLSEPSISNLKTWRFQQEARASFVVKYVYQIEGEETSLAENPKVELELPLLVKITARHIRPTCDDCVKSTPSN